MLLINRLERFPGGKVFKLKSTVDLVMNLVWGFVGVGFCKGVLL